jgi:hypothetical protein
MIRLTSLRFSQELLIRTITSKGAETRIAVWGVTIVSGKQYVFWPETSSPKKDVCCDLVAAICMERIKTGPSGAFPMGCKDERHRASNHGVLAEALGPITV